MARLATVAEQNAAFDAIYPELENLIQQYVPPFFQSQIMDKLHSTNGRALVVKLIKDGLDAADSVGVAT